jgi:glycine cleavage system H protein
MPISGEIIEKNDGLDSSPESVNSDPYGDGWMIKVKMSNPSEMDGLLSADAYREMVGH